MLLQGRWPQICTKGTYWIAFVVIAVYRLIAASVVLSVTTSIVSSVPQFLCTVYVNIPDLLVLSVFQRITASQCNKFHKQLCIFVSYEIRFQETTSHFYVEFTRTWSEFRQWVYELVCVARWWMLCCRSCKMCPRHAEKSSCITVRRCVITL